MHPRLAGLIVAAALTAAGCASTGGSADGGALTSLVIEIGAPLPDRHLDAAVEVIVGAVTPAGGRIEVLVVDGPNADLLDPLELPGITPSGHLDTEARNRTARLQELERFGPMIRDAIETALLEAPTLDNGRDLVGALDRVGERGPDRVVALFTSGGVHRVSDDDSFLESVPDPPEPLALDPDVAVELRNVGRVPSVGERSPGSAVTGSIVAYWTTVCELHGPTCEVVR
ncbi:MAG: hypothetical protein AAFZ07_23245 [Actinomycetota bacterium]